MSDSRPEMPNDTHVPKSRGIGSQLTFGLGFVAIGIVMVGSQIGWIWYRVQNGAGEVTIIKKLLGGGFAVMFIGILHVLGGRRILTVFENMNRGLSEIKWYEWLVLIGVGGAAFACYYGVLHYLRSLGYKATD